MKDKAWAKNKKARYGFWRGTFKATVTKQMESAWIKLQKNGRGSIWVNGMNLGKHWKIGPQDEYKIPVSWLKASNDVLVLEEEASLPQGAEVIFRMKPEEHKIR